MAGGTRALEAMTGHPLDLMLIDDAIDQNRHDAGFYYAYLYGRAAAANGGPGRPRIARRTRRHSR